MGTRWVITGSAGQLGRALQGRLSADGGRILAAPDRAGLDVADDEAVRRFFGELPEAPDVVVNAAAYTHVDRCESEPEAAHRANAVAPGLLARASREAGATLVHVSTDYVFPGDAPEPISEDTPTGPRCVYGRTKLEGEQRVREDSDAHLVVRTSWVYGAGRNFVVAILGQLAARRDGSASGPLRVVDDQRGCPTYAVDLAEGLTSLTAAGAHGVYHLAGAGVATWWDLARESLDRAGGSDVDVDPIATETLDLPAPRPAYSVLDCSKAAGLGVRLRDWREALAAYFASDASPLREGAS